MKKAEIIALLDHIASCAEAIRDDCVTSASAPMFGSHARDGAHHIVTSASLAATRLRFEEHEA